MTITRYKPQTGMLFSTGKVDFLFFALVRDESSHLVNYFHISGRNDLPALIGNVHPGARLVKYPRQPKLEKQIAAWLRGDLAVLPLEELDSRLSGFALRVLVALRKQVRRGETVSYLELARLAGSPKGARAVGTVMRRNPFPLFFPCHRVIKSDGAPGYFSPDPELKLKLLRNEGLFLPD